MAKKRNGMSSAYAKPTTVGNGTLSFQMSAGSTETDVSVRDVLTGVGLLPKVISTTPSLITIGTNNQATIVLPTGHGLQTSDRVYIVRASDYNPGIDAVKISSVTVGPNSGTRLPAEINFKDGQLFRCDNAMKPTKVRPSMKSPAGLWHDATDLDYALFSIKGSNTANPIRVGIAVRQF